MRRSRRKEPKWVSLRLVLWARLSSGIVCGAGSEKRFAAGSSGSVQAGGLCGTCGARRTTFRKRFWTVKWSGCWIDATDDPSCFGRL